MCALPPNELESRSILIVVRSIRPSTLHLGNRFRWSRRRADKIDSSFTRSRSSSGSSSTQHPQQVDSSSCAESILCLCFHDYTTQNLSRSPVMEAGSTTAKSLQAGKSERPNQAEGVHPSPRMTPNHKHQIDPRLGVISVRPL